MVPAGYSFNLDGTAIYMSMAAIFVAQASGVDLSLREQLSILAILMLTSNGAAGVTGSGFITLAATLAAIPSIPPAALALLVGVDRFMSEVRAITNLIGNAVATVAIARWDNALDLPRAQAMLRDRRGESAAARWLRGRPMSSASGGGLEGSIQNPASTSPSPPPRCPAPPRGA